MNLALKLKHSFLLLVLCGILFRPTPILAGVIFESGTLGPTGVAFNDLTSGAVPGTNIKDVAFNGVRFQLTQPATTTQVGGHFVASFSGTFFGAIIKLDDESDFPDSGDLTTPDVLGTTLLTFPVPSTEVFGDLALSLTPGWYALVFGSGLFGATTNGATVRNGTDIGDPAYIGFQPGFAWVNLSSFFDNHRFVVKGSIVPEPTAVALSFLASVLFFCRKSACRR